MAQATVYSKSGTRCEVYSKNGPWKYPLTIRGPVDPGEVTIGHKYEIDLDQKPAQFVRDLGPNPYFEEDCLTHGLKPSVLGEEPRKAAARPPQRGQAKGGQESPYKAAEITGTAVVKSALEGGKTVDQAFIAGCRWTALWHGRKGVPAAVMGWWERNDPDSDKWFGKVPRETSEPEEFNDDIPF